TRAAATRTIPMPRCSPRSVLCGRSSWTSNGDPIDRSYSHTDELAVRVPLEHGAKEKLPSASAASPHVVAQGSGAEGRFPWRWRMGIRRSMVPGLVFALVACIALAEVPAAAQSDRG